MHRSVPSPQARKLFTVPRRTSFLEELLVAQVVQLRVAGITRDGFRRPQLLAQLVELTLTVSYGFWGIVYGCTGNGEVTVLLIDLDLAAAERVVRYARIGACLDPLQKQFDAGSTGGSLGIRVEAVDQRLGFNSDLAVIVDAVIQIDPGNVVIRTEHKPGSNQPFGIFFIEFEPKRLPVTALRRVLGRLVTKKRTSAAQAERQTWNQDDLLFVSAYGGDNTRRIDFAHFADDATRGLPTLRVLGWDDDDTPLRVEWVEKQLHDKLTWPDDDRDADDWRIQWRAAFAERHRLVVNTSKKLAHELAQLAIRIRKRVRDAMKVESDSGPLHKTYTAFRDALIHDLTADGFADMYAQTITYGLLSAGVSRFVPGEGVALLAEDAADLMPPTSPFLKELLNEFVRIGGRQRNGDGTGIDFDELGVNDVVDLLREADLDAVLRDFGRTKPGEDPVIHFYEDFMRDYDAQQRIKRGIYYTPKPVVSFIVRSVDEILREEFSLPLGLADTTTWAEMAARNEGIEIPDGLDPKKHFVQILDPACGTGTFLVEVIDLIYERMTKHWLAEGHMELQIEKLWNDYVADHLLPRLYGFELMMAPYAICHMKVGLKLAETGYRFRSSERLHVFLTNSLEPPHDLSEMLEFVAPFLAHEARAANVVKEQLQPTVVIGNPPYAAASSNMGEWIERLLKGQIHRGGYSHSYYEVDGMPLGERKLWLHDDYVKFIRIAQWWCSSAPAAVCGMITNHGYLDNPTFRGMRSALCDSYQRLRVLNLHGNAIRGDAGRDEQDENVFDIRQGVSVLVAARMALSDDDWRGVYRSDLRGTRQSKYDSCASNTVRTLRADKIVPKAPFYFFHQEDADQRAVFERGAPVTEIFPLHNSGFISARDHLVVDVDTDTLKQRMSMLVDSALSDEAVRAELFGKDAGKKYLPGDTRGWKLTTARHQMTADPKQTDRIVSCDYRPFDRRFVFWAPYMIDWPRPEVTEPLLQGNNIALYVCRQITSDEWRHAFVCRLPATDCYVSNRARERGYLFPLRTSSTLKGDNWNIDNAFLLRVFGTQTCDPIDLLAFVYALLAAPTYRRYFAEQLRAQFPRLFAPAERHLARLLAGLGHDLVALHLLEDDYPHASWNQPGATNRNPFAHPITTFVDEGDREVCKVGETGKKMSHIKNGKGRVSINDTAYFDGVPEAVWNFHIGGYQVCHKWLSDRKKKGGRNPRPGRVLTDEDIAHYHRIVIALSETIRLMTEIDETIEAHGGWPDAFVTDPEELEKLKSNAGTDTAHPK